MYGNWEYGTDWLIIWHKLFNSKARICDITINLSNRPEVLSWPPVALKNSDACIDWTSGLRTGVTRPVDINPSKQTSINDECHSTKPQILNQCYNKIWSYGGGLKLPFSLTRPIVYTTAGCYHISHEWTTLQGVDVQRTFVMWSDFLPHCDIFWRVY